METVVGIIIGLSVSLFMEMIKNVIKILGQMDKAIYREIYKYFLYQRTKTKDPVYETLLENCDSKMYPIILDPPDTDTEFKAKNTAAREFIKLEQKVSLGKEGKLERYSNLSFEADRAWSLISAYQMVGVGVSVIIMLGFIGIFYSDYYVYKIEQLHIGQIIGITLTLFMLLTLVFIFLSLKSPDTEPDCLEKRDLAFPVCLFNVFCMFCGIGVTSLLNVMWYISKGGQIEQISKVSPFLVLIFIMAVVSIIGYIFISVPIFKKINAIVILLGNLQKKKV